MGRWYTRYSYKSRVKDKKLVYLYVNKKLTFSEISKITNISTSTIRRRIIKQGIEPRKGERLLDTTRERISIKNTGRKWTLSEDQKKKLSKMFKKLRAKTAKGWSLKPSGYLEITRGKNRFKSVHRVVMEKHLGRKLKKDEVVHHIDGDKTNNEITNLKVMNRKEHNKLHALENYSKRKRCDKGRFT